LTITLVVGPLLLPRDSDLVLLRWHYLLHDEVWLPAVGRLWREPYPGSAVAAVVAALAVVGVAVLGAGWSRIHLLTDLPPVWWRRLGRHAFHGGG
jgi:hypothetical protein